MTETVNDIRATLEYHLSQVSGVPTVAPQNTKYVPNTNTPFLKTTFNVYSIRPAAVGLSQQKKYSGLLNILICRPEGEGIGDSFEDLGKLLSAFEATKDIKHPDKDFYVTVDYSEPDRGFLDVPFYCTPLNVTWYCYH